jgi:cytochrome c biogenesis protein CcdA
MIPLPLLLSLIGIALVDSLNPTLFVAQLYLFTTPKPIPRILVYILGVIVVNYAAGLLLLGGVRVLITGWVDNLEGAPLFGLQFVLGLSILAFGLWYKAGEAADNPEKKPRSLRLIHSFIFGVMVMLNEMTTALPLFVAVERLGQAQLSAAGNWFALAVYNAVFSLPLFAFMALFVAAQKRFSVLAEKVNHAVQIWTPRIIKWLSILFGGALTLDAAAYFLTGNNVFQ